MTDLKTHDGYMQRFWELVAENRNDRAPMKKALICLESELYARHGLRRYTTYVSFSMAKMRKPQRAKFHRPTNS